MGVAYSMPNGSSILIVGARAGGYGESIARAAVRAGAVVYGTSLSPQDPKEREFFRDLNVTLLEQPLRFDADKRGLVFRQLETIEANLRTAGVGRLDAVVHAVAGGFPRQPSVMKAVSDILKGKQTFADMATAVKRNVYYVNAGSFRDLARGLGILIDADTCLAALTYRGELPYFISDTKRYLERLAVRLADKGKRTLIAALPEAWTQSSQFFTGIELAVIGNYVSVLQDQQAVSPDLADAYEYMEQRLSETEGARETIKALEPFLQDTWHRLRDSGDSAALFSEVDALFSRMRQDGSFSTLRQTVAIISDYVREASGVLFVREFLEAGRFNPGEVRQVYFRDLTGLHPIETAPARPKPHKPARPAKTWVTYEKEDVRETLSMYGEDFLFVDRVVMEAGELHEGSVGFASFTVPTPDKNRLMGDHFVGMPIFGGHLQMEAVAQFGTFMILKALNDTRLVPILTGTEFPDLNTMAPPGEKLTMMGVIHMHDRRNLTLEAFIENRYARSNGSIKGMILNNRLVKKMLVSFSTPNEEE